MLFLGLDIGSSSIKASLYDADKAEKLHTAFLPQKEMDIYSPQKDWAEQDPDIWYNYVKKTILALKAKNNNSLKDVKAIGISYQMHGLVAIDKQGKLVRNAIIWCDSRAVEIGIDGYKKLGTGYCSKNLLNSPGNFTASKLKWVQTYEPQNYKRIYKIMLPGDYIAYKLTGEINTTYSGLSEGILWDFGQSCISHKLLKAYNIEKNLIPEALSSLSQQGSLKSSIAAELGLTPNTPVTYRAGDQPNNAFSLNAMQHGEVAASAGTSGVLYAINERITPDPKSRINSFAHVNHTFEQPKIGQLMCINGTGIAYAWIKGNIAQAGASYSEMNKAASNISEGSEGINIIPFGNGAERILENRNIKCSLHGVTFQHKLPHIIRACIEGISYSFNFGLEIFNEIGILPKSIKAANSGLFQSDLFCEILSNTANINIERYDTDGATGAAIGAALGYNFYNSYEDAAKGLNRIDLTVPNLKGTELYKELYAKWKNILQNEINK